MSQKQNLATQFSYNKTQVLYLTGMTEKEYNNFQVDTAIAWLERNAHMSMHMGRLSDSQVFWKWWKFQWNDVDDREILSVLYTQHRALTYCIYRQIHQYVFCPDDKHLQELVDDFRNMIPFFEDDLKKLSHETAYSKA